MLSTEIAACRSVSWCWAPGVCISRAPCLTLQSLFSPSSHSPLKLETGRCDETGRNLGVPGAKHKSRRQLNSFLHDAALIMELFCSFMRFSSFHLTTWSRLCWVPCPCFFSIAWFLLLTWLFAQPYRKLRGLRGQRKQTS